MKPIEALHWIATVNAMDYEYQKVARTALIEHQRAPMNSALQQVAERREQLKEMKKLALTYPNEELQAKLIDRIDFELAWLKLELNARF